MFSPSIDLRLLVRRVGLAALALAGMFAFNATAALAQSATCNQLNVMLQSLSNNGDFRNSDRANEDLRALQANERNAERAYLRTGCQADQQQGLPQTPQCRGLAQQILSQRAQISQMSQSANNGNAVGQQRQQVLQQMARYGCEQQGSGARFAGYGDQQTPRRRNFLENLFGGQEGYGDTYYDEQQQLEDPYATDQGSHYTIRTVCVRMTDGYYWPISYSTTRDYIPQDAETCQAECPNQQVDLYYYDNPGQEPEQMVNQQGEAYTSLPNAFVYRKNFDLNNSCKTQEATGKITLDALGDGRSRAMVTYDGDSFPLPLRDPRQTEQATTATAAEYATVDIPLPRPRPSATDAAPAVPPTAEPVVSVKSRTVKIGGKIVRIVGPDTPYAPQTGDSG